MADGLRLPSVVQKVAGQSYLVSSPAVNSHYKKYRTCFNGGAQPACHVSGLPVVSPVPPFIVQAPLEKPGTLYLPVGVVSIAVSYPAVAPIERVKLLFQNQNEMIKSGRLSEPSREFRIVLPEPLRMKASFLFGEEILLIFRCFATQAVLFGFKEYLLQEAFQLQEEQR